MHGAWFMLFYNTLKPHLFVNYMDKLLAHFFREIQNLKKKINIFLYQYFTIN